MKVRREEEAVRGFLLSRQVTSIDSDCGFRFGSFGSVGQPGKKVAACVSQGVNRRVGLYELKALLAVGF